MSLTFDTTGCDLPDNYIIKGEDGDHINPTYEVIIMPGTLLTGIGELTDKTIPEFWARFHTYEMLEGALLRNQDGPKFTEFETVVAMKGLKTNVFPQESRAKWVNRIVKARMDGMVNQALRDIEKAKKNKTDADASAMLGRDVTVG